MSDHDLYFKDFEEAGEEVVRRNLQLEKYQPQKAKIAQLFLDRLREARRAAAEADQTEIARSAKALRGHQQKRQSNLQIVRRGRTGFLAPPWPFR
jgi:hypothetical protein